MTIWIRRAGAVVLGIVFFVALATTLVIHAANSTVARPGFLADQLEEADAYAFVIDDLTPALLEDAWRLDADAFGWEFEENPLVASGLTPGQVAAAVRRALPPEDLEMLLAPAVEQVGAFVAGERDEATIRVDAAAHLDALVTELNGLMLESGGYARLLEHELTPIFAEWVDEGLPPAGDDSRWVGFLRGPGDDAGGSLVRVFTRVVTPEWIAAQAERAGDELVAYGVGRSEGFEVRITLDEAQVEEAAAEIEAVILEADAFDVAYETVVEPVAEERLAEAVELPYGIIVDRPQVLDALRDAVSADWLDGQAAVLAADVATYVTGQTDAFVAEFDIVPARDRAARALTAAASDALRDRLNILPRCTTAAQTAAAREALRTELPACLPRGVVVNDVVRSAGPVLAAAIRESVLAPVPDSVSYSEQDLRLDLEEDGGPDALVALDDVRSVFSHSWTYTDADLRDDLADEGDALDLVDDLRAVLSTGYDLETPDGAVEAAEAGARVWLPGLVTAILLAAVAFLGGRSWRGRLAWAAATLLVAAAVIAVVSGPVYQSASGTIFDEIRGELAAEPGDRLAVTSDLLVDKLIEVVERAADEFTAPIARVSLILAVGGAIAVVAAFFWSRLSPAPARAQP